MLPLLPFVVIIFIFTIHRFIEYRRDLKKADGEEEIRHVLVRFGLAVFLFIMSIILLVS